jgi:hypothetical protein
MLNDILLSIVGLTLLAAALCAAGIWSEVRRQAPIPRTNFDDG